MGLKVRLLLDADGDKITIGEGLIGTGSNARARKDIALTWNMALIGMTDLHVLKLLHAIDLTNLLWSSWHTDSIILYMTAGPGIALLGRIVIEGKFHNSVAVHLVRFFSLLTPRTNPHTRRNIHIIMAGVYIVGEDTEKGIVIGKGRRTDEDEEDFSLQGTEGLGLNGNGPELLFLFLYLVLFRHGTTVKKEMGETLRIGEELALYLPIKLLHGGICANDKGKKISRHGFQEDGCGHFSLLSNGVEGSNSFGLAEGCQWLASEQVCLLYSQGNRCF
jgi:hypothetical protein